LRVDRLAQARDAASIVELPVLKKNSVHRAPRIWQRRFVRVVQTVLQRMAWAIGEILNISKRTVDEHAQTTFRKLGAANRTHAVAIALRHGIIEI
jgi:LuxR family quorum sensing-dependent transcriptional regulator